VLLKGLGQLKNTSNELIENRTRDLPACSIVSQSSTLPFARYSDLYTSKVNLDNNEWKRKLENVEFRTGTISQQFGWCDGSSGG
jgi:hypothetical protein